MLSIDPLWRGFMNYVYAHGGWSGDAPGWDTTVPVQTDVDYAAAMRAAAPTLRWALYDGSVARRARRRALAPATH